MLSKVNKITLQKKLQNFMTHRLLDLVPKSKTQQQQNKKSKYENPYQSQESNPGLLALQSDT